MTDIPQIHQVNSRNRISGTDDNFSYQLNIPEGHNRVAVLEMSVPKSYYIVEEGFNTFELQEGGSPVDSVMITVPPGNYNRRSLQSVVSSLLNANSPNGWSYTISYPNENSQSDTGKYTFTVSKSPAPSPDEQPSFIFTNGLFEPLGFNRNSTNTFVDDELISTNVIKIVREDTLFLKSDLISFQKKSIIAWVFTSSNPTFSSVVYKNPDPLFISQPLANNKSNTYSFQLVNEDNFPIVLNGINMNIILLTFNQNNMNPRDIATRRIRNAQLLNEIFGT